MNGLETIYIISVIIYVFTFFVVVSIIEKLATSLRRTTILLKRKTELCNRLMKQGNVARTVSNYITAGASGEISEISEEQLKKEARDKLYAKLAPYIEYKAGATDTRKIITANLEIMNEKQN